MRLTALIVGAGFSGSVIARELAEKGWMVQLIDKRTHIGGNAYDSLDEAGILVHNYGPHIFHTNSDHVFNYLSRFTDWRPYEHHVLSFVDGALYPFPINIDTLNQLYHLSLDEPAMRLYIEQVRVRKAMITTSEDFLLDLIGEDLYKRFFRNYTKKQWGVEPSALRASVAARIPLRYDRDRRYFTDKYQFMPKFGYTRLFENILDHTNIRISLSTTFSQIDKTESFTHTIYTGMVDEFYGYRFGQLPYRSLRFVRKHFQDMDFVQPVAVINYPGMEPFTRTTEFKFLTGQLHRSTTIYEEYPSGDGDPYYPFPNDCSEFLYQRYKDFSDEDDSVSFAGRLGTYRYYNMDQVVAQAIKKADVINKRFVR